MNRPRRNDGSKVFRQAVSYCLKACEERTPGVKIGDNADQLKHDATYFLRSLEQKLIKNAPWPTKTSDGKSMCRLSRNLNLRFPTWWECVAIAVYISPQEPWPAKRKFVK